MNTFGLNLFGGGTGNTYLNIGPELDIWPEPIDLTLETEVSGVELEMESEDVIMDVDSTEIVIIRSPDGFIIGTC